MSTHSGLDRAVIGEGARFPHLHAWRVLGALLLGLGTVCPLVAWRCIRAGDAHWLNRVGGTIVIASLVLTFWQLGYEWRREERREIDRSAWTRRFIELGRSVEEAEAATRALQRDQSRWLDRNRLASVLIALGTAATGEVVHSFGDLIAVAIGFGGGE